MWYCTSVSMNLQETVGRSCSFPLLYNRNGMGCKIKAAGFHKKRGEPGIFGIMEKMRGRNRHF